jgi:hypothetical protein
MLVVALTGCATKGHFESIYGSWVGAPIKIFAEAYGIPSSVKTDGDNLVYEYELKRTSPCRVFWTVDKNGMIVQWRHEGRGCKLAPLG